MRQRADHRESDTTEADLVAAAAQLRAQLRRPQDENRNLRRENDVLREAAAPLIHGAPARERCAFIDSHRSQFSAKPLCRVLVTDRGSYYTRVRAGDKRLERESDDRRPTELILKVMALPFRPALRCGRTLSRLSEAAQPRLRLAAATARTPVRPRRRPCRWRPRAGVR